MTTAEKIQKIADRYGLGISKEDLAGKIYFELQAAGTRSWIINDRYIGTEAGDYQLIKSKAQARWIVKQI